jgi:transcriptional regulator with XRE-family HTH domain
MTELKDRINYILKNENLKKKDFAARLHLSRQFVTFLCKGERNISDQTAALVAKEFGYREEWVLNGTGDPKDPVDPLEERRKALLERLSHRSEAELVAILQFLEKIEQPGDTTTLADAFELGYEAARRIREAERKEENEEDNKD